MSSTPPPPPGNIDDAFLEEIGLRDVLEEGVVRLLETCPRPSSLLEALRVISAHLAKDIEADGESKDDAAAETTLSVFVETLVRSLVWRCSSHTAAPTRCSHAHL